MINTPFLRLVRRCACVAILPAFSLPLSAAVISWNGAAADGAYATAGNWVGGAAPANNDWQDTASFATGTTGTTITVPSGRQMRGLYFGSSGWTLSGGPIQNVLQIDSMAAGTTTVACHTSMKSSAHAAWTVVPDGTLVLSGGFYQRNSSITLSGGGTIRFTAAPSGFGGTVGSWGFHIHHGRLSVAATSPYQAASAGAVFIHGPQAVLELQTTIAGAQSLIATGRVVDALGDGLDIIDAGNGLIEITATPVANDPTPPVPGNWELTFEDTFQGTTLDGTKWRLGQHYSGMAGSAGVAPENVEVGGGLLRLRAEQRSVTYGGATRSYATGEISSFALFRQQHGYFEARMRYPAVTGLWPAFWLMPDRADYGWRDGYYRAFLKFDLSGLPPGPITSAELRMKVTAVESGGDNNVVLMRVEDDSWSEQTVTWNNQPIADPVWISQRWNGATVGQDMVFDVRDFVTAQHAGNGVASFLLADTYMKTKSVTFGSREAANAADRPRLIINGVTYYPVADATVRWGTLANTNYGTTTQLTVRDSWGNAADTFGGGMEIDIMEALGIWGANRIQHAVHWDGYGSSHKSREWTNITMPSTEDGFHTYGMYWEPGLLEFYVDGVKTAEMEDSRVMSVPAFLILSLQTGGWGNNNPGPQVHDQTMEVDWVRVWSGEKTPPSIVTVDNADAAFVSATGSWSVSNATAGFFGADYRHDENSGKGAKKFTFRPALTAHGDYLVYARWPAASNRASQVPMDVRGADGSLRTFSVDQRSLGGQWNLLGAHTLSASNAEVAVRTDGTSDGFVMADAVRLAPGNPAAAIQVDDADAGTTVATGAWTVSSALPGYIGTGYRHDGNTGKGTKSFGFRPAIPSSGDYLVYARWSADPNRASQVPVDIVTPSGVQTITVDQRERGNTWNLLGAWRLAPDTAEIRFRNDSTNGFVVVDAVKVVPAAVP